MSTEQVSYKDEMLRVLSERAARSRLLSEAGALGLDIPCEFIDAAAKMLSAAFINNSKAAEMLSSVADELFAVISRLNKYEASDISCDNLDPPDLTDMQTIYEIKKFLSEL